MQTFNNKVYEIVRHIPYGMVINYGGIAKLTGSPWASRAVGYALHALPDPENTPWHRVVFKDGSLPKLWGEPERQYELLRAEKISFDKERKVKMNKHLWDGAEFEAVSF